MQKVKFHCVAGRSGYTCIDFMHGRAAMLLDDTGIVMTFDNMTSKNELLILTMFLPEDDKTDAKLINIGSILLWTSPCFKNEKIPPRRVMFPRRRRLFQQ